MHASPRLPHETQDLISRGLSVPFHLRPDPRLQQPYGEQLLAECTKGWERTVVRGRRF